MEKLTFERVVDRFYEGLYRFALSLTRHEAEACDLTQETFYIWATKGHQLRDPGKVKSWLFTTLHREFLGRRRRSNRFRHYEVESVAHELPAVSPKTVLKMDASLVLDGLKQVDEIYRVPLMLFYLEQHAYHEIATILDVPIGTVMSRLSRGKAQLKKIMSDQTGMGSEKIVRLKPQELDAKKPHEL